VVYDLGVIAVDKNFTKDSKTAGGSNSVSTYLHLKPLLVDGE